MTPRKLPSVRARALAAGYRSGLEERVGEQLSRAGIACEYESLTINYKKPAKNCRYTPDWPLPNYIIVETKGRFVTADRQKHLYIQEQYPDLDIRFVFSNPNTKIGKTSTTTYAMWCEKHGFPYAAKTIPEEWLKEKPKKKSLEAIREAVKK